MSNQINLDISNFGAIENAHIELKRLNVIAGINGSGKSTSSKLLYCFLASNSSEGTYLANKSINDRFIPLLENLEEKLELDSNLPEIKKVINNLPKLTDKNYNSKLNAEIRSLKRILNNCQIKNKNKFLEQIREIEYGLELNKSEHRKYFNVSNFLLSSEFNFHDLELYNNTKIKFFGKGEDCEFSHEIKSDNEKIGFKINEGLPKCLNFENIIYIDSQSIFDIKYSEYSSIPYLPYHLRVLFKILNSPKREDVYDQEFNRKLDEFKDKFQNLMKGHIFYDDKTNEFLFKKDNKNYSMKNTASGVKQLGILQMLISKRLLTKDSFLIMDEPEVNLHPDWQVKFAKIIVLMVKELGISLYINSHSPQFIESLEVYSAKYGLINESKFYLSKEIEQEIEKYEFKEVKRKNLNLLYDDLGNPYDEIDKIRIENVFNGIK